MYCIPGKCLNDAVFYWKIKLNLHLVYKCCSAYSWSRKFRFLFCLSSFSKVKVNWCKINIQLCYFLVLLLVCQSVSMVPLGVVKTSIGTVIGDLFLFMLWITHWFKHYCGDKSDKSYDIIM